MKTAGRAQPMPVVLVVGLPDSVHTARWLNMLLGRGLRFVLLPAYIASPSTEFFRTRLISGAEDLANLSEKEVGVFDVGSVSSREVDFIQSRMDYEPWKPAWLGACVPVQPAHVVVAIQRLRPALIHSMVVQFGGYLALAARQYLQEQFPAWLLSNWGSDIFLYRMMPDHQEKISQIASLIDAYHAECERDIGLIRQMGFRRLVFPALPATGGIDFHSFPPLEAFRRPSERREILIKGYHGWSGRGLHIMSAVHLAADVLRGYTIRVILASPQVKETARTIAAADGLEVIIDSYLPDHREALVRLGSARAVIGLGISDGISTTLLESMSVGTFPIQGSCSCGSEWIVQNETGILVSPHDIRALAESIRRAVTDDRLVNAAALRNRETVERRWNAAINGEIASQNYHSLIESVTTPGKTPAAMRGNAGALHG